MEFCVSLKKSLITIEVTNLALVEYLPCHDHLFFTKLPRSLRADPRKQYEHHFTDRQRAARSCQHQRGVRNCAMLHMAIWPERASMCRANSLTSKHSTLMLTDHGTMIASQSARIHVHDRHRDRRQSDHCTRACA